MHIVFDLAYVGSKSDDHPAPAADQRGAARRHASSRENQDPTRAASSTPGAAALPNDFLRPYQGYGDIRMWDYSGYANYNALQTSVTRRFDKGYMFSVFYVWSKTLTIANDDFTAGVPNASEEETRRLDYSYANYDRPHNFVVNAIYQVPKFANGIAGHAGRTTGSSRASTAGRAAGPTPSPTPSLAGHRQCQPHRQRRQPAARIVVTCDPGQGLRAATRTSSSTRRASRRHSRAATARESARFFLHGPPPINNVDLSLSKRFSIVKGTKLELRLDAFNALNHTQFTGVNAPGELREPDRPRSPISRTSVPRTVNKNGFGTINGVANPRTLQLVARFTF